MSNNTPNFIVLGGHKCGTSSLHTYLAQHPDIYMPSIKGTDFFTREGNRGKYSTFEEYQSLYKDRTNEKVAGEVSSIYLYSDRACQTIKNYLPEVKLIIILRNPIERAFSHFNTLPERQNPTENLEEIFTKKHVLEMGLYVKALEMYFNDFKPENIKVFLFENVIKNNNFTDLFEFIGVAKSFLPDTSLISRKGGVVNQNKQKQLELLRSTIGKIIKPFTSPEQRRYLYKQANNAVIQKIVLPEDIKEKLKEYYQEDIQKTQEFLGIDLSHWLTK